MKTALSAVAIASVGLPHFFLVGRDHHRIGVLDQHRLNWAAPFERLAPSTSLTGL